MLNTTLVWLQNAAILLCLFLLFAGGETNMFFFWNEKKGVFLGSTNSINLQEEKHHTEKTAKKPLSEPMDALTHTVYSISSL